MREIAEPDGVEPEHVVQRVMKAEGNEQPVQECVDARADSPHARDRLPEEDQRLVEQRPDEEQEGGDDDGNEPCHDGDASLPAEKRQPVRQLRIPESIAAKGADDAREDAGERVGNLREGQRAVCVPRDGGGELHDEIEMQERRDHEP